MSRKKKVLIISWGYTPIYSQPGPSRALYIFNEIKKSFTDTYIIMQKLEGKASGVENLIQINPIIPIEGKLQLLKGIIFRLQIAIFTLGFVFSKKIDHVILRGYDTILIYPFLKLANIKTFYDFHGLYNFELAQENRHLRAFFVRYIDKMILNMSTKIIVVSDGIKMQIPEHQNKCLTLPNGVDIEKIRNANYESTIKLPINKKIIGFIGNWELVMKMEDICESIEYLDNTIALIIGEGYNLEDLFRKYNNNPKIIFTGKINQNNVYSLLNKMDICIIPYNKNSYMSKIRDFFSNRKVTEYLAAGKPIIIANIIGRPSYLQENTNCLLYESGNPKDLAEKIRMLLDDKKLYKNLSENNKKLSKEFCWDKLVEDSGLISILK